MSVQRNQLKAYEYRVLRLVRQHSPAADAHRPSAYIGIRVRENVGSAVPRYSPYLERDRSSTRENKIHTAHAFGFFVYV
jgi:hypothetical protein